MRASRERTETGAENASSCSRPNGEAPQVLASASEDVEVTLPPPVRAPSLPPALTQPLQLKPASMHPEPPATQDDEAVRGSVLFIRLAEDDHARVKDVAARAGMTTSGWARAVLLGAAALTGGAR